MEKLNSDDSSNAKDAKPVKPPNTGSIASHPQSKRKTYQSYKAGTTPPDLAWVEIKPLALEIGRMKVLTGYRLGKIAKDFMSQDKRTHAVLVGGILEDLGFGDHALDDAIKVVETWSEEQIKEILDQQKRNGLADMGMGWSDFVNLAKTEDKTLREEILNAILAYDGSHMSKYNKIMDREDMKELNITSWELLEYIRLYSGFLDACEESGNGLPSWADWPDMEVEDLEKGHCNPIAVTPHILGIIRSIRQTNKNIIRQCEENLKPIEPMVRLLEKELGVPHEDAEEDVKSEE